MRTRLTPSFTPVARHHQDTVEFRLKHDRGPTGVKVRPDRDRIPNELRLEFNRMAIAIVVAIMPTVASDSDRNLGVIRSNSESDQTVLIF